MVSGTSEPAGFLPAESGQKPAGRPGIPFGIESADGSQFVQIRMYRLSTISGAVLDENGVGLPDTTVHVFTVKPVRHVGQGTTDDHGRFRVDGSNPGAYVVHTGATVLEGSIVPSLTANQSSERVLKLFPYKPAMLST